MPATKWVFTAGRKAALKKAQEVAWAMRRKAGTAATTATKTATKKSVKAGKDTMKSIVAETKKLKEQSIALQRKQWAIHDEMAAEGMRYNMYGKQTMDRLKQLDKQINLLSQKQNALNVKALSIKK